MTLSINVGWTEPARHLHFVSYDRNQNSLVVYWTTETYLILTAMFYMAPVDGTEVEAFGYRVEPAIISPEFVFETR